MRDQFAGVDAPAAARPSIGPQAGASFARSASRCQDLAPEARVATPAAQDDRPRAGAGTAGREPAGIRRALDRGFSAVELRERCSRSIRNQLQAGWRRVRRPANVRSRGRAWLTPLRHQVFSSPATDLALFEIFVQRLQPADIDTPCASSGPAASRRSSFRARFHLEDPRSRDPVDLPREPSQSAGGASRWPTAVVRLDHDFGQSLAWCTDRAHRGSGDHPGELRQRRRLDVNPRLSRRTRCSRRPLRQRADRPAPDGQGSVWLARMGSSGRPNDGSMPTSRGSSPARQADIDLVLGDSGS